MKKFLLFLIGLLVIRFFPIFLGDTFVFGDTFSLLVPGKIFTAQWIQQGILPLWNPYLFAGFNWIGNLNESVLYPSTLFFVFFNPSTALNGTILLHMLISGCGVYLLANHFMRREWAKYSAVALWMLSSQLTASVDNFSVLQSATYIPWIILASITVRQTIRSQLFLSAVILLQLLGGYPQLIPYSVLFGFLCHLYLQRTVETKSSRQSFLLFLKVGICTLLLGSIAWMPFLELLQSSTRSVQSTAQLTAGSFHPLELLRLFIPTLFDNPTIGMRWGPFWNRNLNAGIYVGYITLVSLWVVYRKKRSALDSFFFCLVSGSLILALLGFVGISPLQFLPILSSSRGTVLILLPTALLVSLWAGSVFERIEFSRSTYKALILFTGILLLGSILSVFITHFFFEAGWKSVNTLVSGRLAAGWHTVARDLGIVQSILFQVSLSLLSFGVAISLLYRKRYWIFVLVLCLDLHVSTSSRLTFAPRNVYPTWTEIKNAPAHPLLTAQKNDRVFIAQGNIPYTDFSTYWEARTVRPPYSDSFVNTNELQKFTRLQAMRDGMTPDWNMVYGIRSLTGYAAFVPKDVDTAFNTTTESSINSLPEISPFHKKVTQYGATTYWLDTWYPHSSGDPRFLPENSFGAYQLFVLPSRRGRFSFADNSSPKNLQVKETPNRQEIRFEASEDTTLFIADQYDPGWMVSVNGSQSVLESYDGIRKIQVPKGMVTLVLSYRPRSLQVGAVVSLFTALFIGYALYTETKKNKTKNQQTS